MLRFTGSFVFAIAIYLVYMGTDTEQLINIPPSLQFSATGLKGEAGSWVAMNERVYSFVEIVAKVRL